jgi:hypothetical protein
VRGQCYKYYGTRVLEKQFHSMPPIEIESEYDKYNSIVTIIMTFKFFW